MQQKPEPAEPSLRIGKNFAFFEEQMNALGTTALELLCKGLESLRSWTFP